VIMVTHSREIVNAMGKRVVGIRNGRLVRDERSGLYHPEYDDDSEQFKPEETLPL